MIRGGTHYEWSKVPSSPARSWDVGNALADHYSLAWLDRWLKRPGEDGYRTADDRLLADDDWRDQLSFYYRSKRAFPTRAGDERTCENIRAGCTDEPGKAPTGRGRGGSTAADGDSTSTPTSGRSLF